MPLKIETEEKQGGRKAKREPKFPFIGELERILYRQQPRFIEIKW